MKVIADTNECLRMEPLNLKALIRKGQAFIGMDMLVEAYDTFEKVLQIDATNQFAQSEIIKLQKKIPQKNSFRMTITEIDNARVDEKPAKKIIKSEKLEISETSHVPKLVQNIVAEETSPLDKLMPKKKMLQSREKLFTPSDATNQQIRNNDNGKTRHLIQEIN